jgi:hypothetical protein
MRRLTLLSMVCLLLPGCDLLGPDDGGNVAVRFAVANSSALADASSLTALATSGAQSLPVQGRNGTLLLERVVLLVDEVELEGHGDACERDGDRRGRDDDEADDEDDEDDEDDDHGRQCRFEAEAFVLDLPVDGSPITIASELIPDGVYDELEFEIKNIKLEREKDRVIDMLTAEVLARFPSWPSQASAMLEGSFQPAGGGDARPFRIFLDADLEVEMELEPPLVISDDAANRVITVEVHPELWFRRIDGSVVDLSLFDFERTHRVIQVDLFERGFRRGHDHD